MSTTKAFILALALTGSQSAFGVCTTFTCMPEVDNPEHHEVTGSRIPGYMFASEQSVEFKAMAAGGGGGGGPASAAEVNDSGAKKAEKAKAEEKSTGSNWFSSAFEGIKSIGRMFSSKSIDSGVEVKATKAPDGSESVTIKACLQYAQGSHNNKGCSETKAIKRTDGKIYIEVHRLLAKQDSRGRWRLVYSTEDTISFLVNDPEEALNVFRAIDPTLN